MSDEKQRPIPKFIVAMSFSRKAELALEFALTYAPPTGAAIYIVHVFEGSTGNFRRMDKLNAETMDRMQQVMANTLGRLRQRGITPNVTAVERRFGNGKVGDELLAIAEGLGPDMLILGAPSSNAFKKLITNAPCNLVLIKEKEA